MKRLKYIGFLMALLLLLCGMATPAWAAKVTYHILTLPIDNDIYHMRSTFDNQRLEAVRVVVEPATSVELPAAFKSPLAKNFRYYLSGKVTQNAAAQSYDISAKNKSRYYSIPNETDSITTSSYTVTSNIDVYVTYEYDNTKGLLLDGTAKYNIPMSGGFLALNRGRNNRLAVISETSGLVSAEDLVSEDFVRIADASKDKIPGTNITTYWNGNTANPKASVAGQFHFMFQFVGFDPYNILIRTAYDRDYTYLEKHGTESSLLYKWYKGSYLFKPSSDGNCFMASDDHKVYTLTGSSYNPDEDPAITSSTSTGYFHNKGSSDITYNSFVLLNNTSGTGYIFMVSRPVGDNGDLSTPSAISNSPKYSFLIRDNNYNNLTLSSLTLSDASKSYSTDQKIYPIRNVNFKVKTPFYAIEATSAHIVTAVAQLSQYTIDNDDIDADFIPAELRRKYCNFPGTFRDKDGKAITKYSQAYNEDTETYDIYVDYTVQNAPFTAIAPKSTAYTAAELNAATWYELTDDGSTELSGKKLVYDNPNFKNNGASGTFNKTSEYAFIGDPYELRVILRSTTTNTASPLGPHYVGVTGDTPSAGTDFTVGASATAGYKWEIPYDATAGSFNLRIYTTDCSGTGYWSWNTGNASVDVTYGTTPVAGPTLTSNPQIVTLNVTGLTYAVENYLEVTKSGAGSGQVGTITIGDISSDGKATITAVIVANSSSNKEFTLTITEKNGSGSTVGTVTAVNFTQGTSAYAGSNVQYNTTATRVKLLALRTRTYTYKVVDKSGRVAVKASIDQTIFMPLSTTVSQRLESSLPSIIVSPFLVGETLAFYDDAYVDNSGRGSLSSSITETPNTDHDIFVTYTTAHLDEKPFKLSEDQEFNVVLNGQYLYYDSSDGGAVKSNSSPSDSDKGSAPYLWRLRNRDPYAMLVDNMGARSALSVTGKEDVTVYEDNGSSSTQSRDKGAWVDVATIENEGALSFTTIRANAQQFIAKSGLQGGVYEVMVADGGTNDASTTYYNIGRTSNTDIKIYSNSAYPHGNNVLKFQLEQTIDYTYHLIDKYDHVLLTQKSQSPDLVLPAEYQSPLVADYHYYDKDNIDIDGDKYTVKEDSPVELTALSGLDATFTKTSGDYSSSWESTGSLTATSADDVDTKAKKLTAKGHYYYRIGETTTYYDVEVTKELYRDIYVTYDVNDRVKFNDKASPYMLRFLQPFSDGYYLEDGNDNLNPYNASAADGRQGRIQAVYPYCNGDGSLNIYGSAMNEEQMNGGAATRPRWTWFFESEKEDPYHVMIHSNNTISFNGVSHPTYLQTFAVDFVQEATTPKHIVTCGTLPTVGSEDITEYMILGTDGQFKLKTTKEINDGTGSARRDVTSLEQYWKTYNMIKKYVLEIDTKEDATYKDAFSNTESTWVVPTELRATLETKLSNLHVGTGQWHSFPIYANAVRWNGYNDKSDGHEKKCVERLEHWFQTFDVGDGTFDIESANIPPVLILLDRHGWEIMRKPLPNISYYPEGEELDALRIYDSPMVDSFYFYSNATKATGCHKYSLRMQNGAERDQIKVNGKRFASTSLGDLPPIDATGVKSNGMLNDQYVTYTVKEEYEKSFTYNFIDHGNGSFTESGTASKFVMVQNGRFYKNRNNNTSGQESYFSKPIFEHTYPEGGNVYDLIVSAHDNAVNGVADVNGDLTDICKWYVMPNLNIDKEMGIKYAETAGGSSEPKTEYETKKGYYETGKGGFDPYNIQLKNVGEDKFLTSHITSANRRNGVLAASYEGDDYYHNSGTTRLTLETGFTSYNTTIDKGSEGYDHTNLQISNQTFMAVSDANGNMQLMPRFDHSKRVNLPTTSANNDPWPTTLEESVDYEKGDGIAEVDDNNKMGPQTVFFVRPQRFVYRIIDNDGNEALRYKRAGDYYPTITDHFKSPLATDFKFYYDHAAYTSSVSSAAAYTAAATSTYFQKTATNDAALATAAKALTVVDDYYFKIGGEAPFTYKKVTVTKAHSGSDDATYTTTDCTEEDWTNATVHQETRVVDLAALQTAVDNLATTGTHYFEIGPFVKDDVSTYIYKKIIVTSGKSNFLTDVRDKNDISDKEITGQALAEFDFDADENTIYVRYSYDESADLDGDKILLGKWFTIKLNNLDVVASGTIVTKDDPETVAEEIPGTGVSLLQGTSKPGTIDEDDKTWQWKFLVAPIDPSSELHESPDPYAIQIFNRDANKDTSIDPSTSKMRIPIKVNGTDRFSLLRHPSGGYALAVNGLETYNYSFLNGSGMTTSVAATTALENNYQRTVANYDAGGFETARSNLSGQPDGDYYFKIYDGNKNASYKKVTVTSGTPGEGVSSTVDEWNGAYHFTIKSGVLSPGTQLILNNDVTHNYNYSVINNAGSDYVVDNPGYLAVEATQNDAAAAPNGYAPYLPLEAQSELLNADEDYLYYGSATLSDGKYTVATTTKLFTLYGLYDDQVYVRYKKYDPAKGVYEVPNKRNAKESTTVARDPGSQDVALNIKGELPYNIIWYDNNMMSTESEETTAITDGGKQDLSGLKKYVWYFEGNDPYALKIRHKLSSNYVNGTGTLVASAGDAKQFMLLKKTGYDYGILAETGNQNTKLSGYGQTTTTGDPTEFIIFGLSVHDLIYRLIIAKTCPNKTADPLPTDEYVDIPYMESESGTLTTKRIYGTTQRDLTSVNTGEGTHYDGEKYQLGETLEYGGNHVTYCYDAGTVSIGDVLEVPSVFDRPNCTFEFYIEGVYDYDKETGATTENDELNTLYKGLKLKNLMSDSRLIDKTVVVNIVYLFDQTVATNTGLGFVTSTDQNLWYTFETNESTPYLARYTNTQGVTAVSGKTTHYTNDYLWTPVGDVYGFKMYNRYVLKNSSDSGDDPSRVMTTSAIANNQAIEMLEPVESSPAEGQSLKGYEVYELLADKSTPSGCFYVHPVVNNSGTQYYLIRVGNSLKLSSGENPTQWSYGLDLAMLQPYYLGAGNVGGLTTTPKAGRTKSGKTLYEEALAKDPVLVTDLQEVVYNDDNIVDFATGYYRLHSQLGITGVSPVRYASGYLHEIEKTGEGAETPGAIPMHFYSKAGVTGTFDGDTNPLESGFTVSNATRGDIPVPATEADPSTIFRVVNGTSVTNRTISNVTMSTQGLNVIGCTMGTGDATTYRLIDIGGGVVILVNTATRYYFNFNQSSNKYDLKYSEATSANIDDVKWCMEPANTLGLQVTMNNGGDDYYYATFCAPYDVVLPADDGDKKYYAYVCDKWSDTNLHPTKVPEVTGSPSYAAGKFVPAGTPVIFRIKDESGSMKLTLPNSSPASPVAGNIFSGKYLEQLLPLDAGDKWLHDVYTLGLPFTSDVQKDEDYDTTGDIDAPLPTKASSGLGFYVNATPNKENGAVKARWDKNNRYVLHNKIYYRATGGGGGAPSEMRDVQYVPVIFDDDEGGEEEQPEENQPQPTRVGDGCVYDILGRKVASAEEVKAGTWYRHLSPGVYIVNGQKVFVGVGRM
ncbi:MAG: hypothetical protein E7074_04160 [Bacteroidales bacterium]|nr:hypothetical protein [Bacteroidales bacterium]